ncbi:MAG: radical SAM family heme chaperone HemW [Meiothermus sp.]|uniref:radical SAM family heme chaperone HemW n=2 Tax=Meiothermus sp. TaxID=1955249 RepID=UPI0025D31040|nr:radical SAM family heme chaperone HemW [Meiothermus sp.]MCS7068878.1 radical SAM family heme chaperone HemW [Meiothermus sp.]
MQGLYIHVPFCPTICPYCDFHVVRRHGGVVAAYLKRLVEEARALYEQYPGPLQTLYLGGGTPSFLRNAELEALFAALPWQIGGAEVTLEANPGTLNPERLALLKNLGVNRLSLGVQSFQEGVLKTLGRAHGRKGALKAVEMSLEAGFRTSIDLILGLPGQNLEADLREARALGVGHVSAYTLQIEPGTPFELSRLQTDEEQEALAFERAEALLGEAGFVRYEVSNFARPHQESQHNTLYWRLGFWGALGPGAAAHLPAGPAKALYAVRATNPPLPRWLAGEAPTVEEISPLEHAKEALMLGLRLSKGVDVREIERRTGLDLWSSLSFVAERLASQGHLALEARRIRARSLSTIHPLILQLWNVLDSVSLPDSTPH